MALSNFRLPNAGERALIVGQSGSGKTTFGRWLIERVHYPVIVYDTKIEPAYDIFPVTSNFDEILPLFSESADIVVFRPPDEYLADPKKLDEFLYLHYRCFPGIGAFIDEAYQFHNGVKAGVGLVSLLTRGRSKRIATIVSSQRPSWLSRFAITESNLFYIFLLADSADRKRLADIVPKGEDLLADKFHLYYYESGADCAMYYAPVPLVESTRAIETE